jgi:cell division protein FtsL
MAVKIVGARRNSTTVMIVAGIAVVIFAIGAVLGILYFNRVKGDYESKLSAANSQLEDIKQELSNGTRFVYVPKEDLKYNTKLEETMLERVEILSSLPQDQYMNEEDFGKLLNSNLQAQMPVLKYMLQDNIITDDLRDTEFNTLTLQTNIAKNDFVDVRIRFPNGEDYIVLSKKKVNNIKLSTGTTKLYVVKYVQPQTQKTAATTYPFNNDVQAAMMRDPNILDKATIAMAAQARLDLEARINIIPKESLNSVGSGVQQETTGLEKNIQELQKEQEEAAKAGSQTNQSNPTTQTGNQTPNNGANPIVDDTDAGSSIGNVF